MSRILGVENQRGWREKFRIGILNGLDQFSTTSWLGSFQWFSVGEHGKRVALLQQRGSGSQIAEMRRGENHGGHLANVRHESCRFLGESAVEHVDTVEVEQRRRVSLTAQDVDARL